MRPVTLLLFLAAVCFPVGAHASPVRVGTGSAALTQLERSDPVFDVLYRYGQTIGAASGAYGPNVTAPRSAWYLEYQRAGAVDVIDGVIRPDTDPALVSQGLRMFHFGLARQARDGSFPGSAWPFHGTALFLSEAGPALLILQQSELRGQFATELKWETDRIRRAAYAMVRSVGGPGKIDDRTKNHRWYEAAIALISVGILAGDATLVRWSMRYAWRAVRMERADGVMPEDGGHDTGYQALGMVSASRFLVLLGPGSLTDAVRGALARGEAWELSRIGPDGSVNQTSDTRTAGCREHDPAGHCKTVFYAPIFNALAHWAVISGEKRFAVAAHSVWVRSGYGGH